jgi:hypothetical protein
LVAGLAAKSSVSRFYQVQWPQLEETVSIVRAAFAGSLPPAAAANRPFTRKINGLHTLDVRAAVAAGSSLAPVTFPPGAHRPQATDSSFNVCPCKTASFDDDRCYSLIGF